MDENPYKAPLGSSSFSRSRRPWLALGAFALGTLVAISGLVAMVRGFDLGMDAFDRGEPSPPLGELLFVFGGPLFLSGGFVAACGAIALLYRMFCQIPSNLGSQRPRARL